MNRSSTYQTVFRMEAVRFFRDPKQVMTSLFFGPVMVFLMLLALSGISNSSSRIEIYGAEAFRSTLEEWDGLADILFKTGVPDQPATVSPDRNVVLLHVTEDQIRVYYDSSMVGDQLLRAAQELAERIAALQINAGQYPAYEAAVSAVQTVDISTVGDYIGAVLIPIVSMVAIVAMLLSNTSVSSLAMDSIAGERERGTLDMLRLSGARIGVVLAGKYGFLVFVTMLTLTAEALAMLWGLRQFQRGLYDLAAAQAAQYPLWWLPMLACLTGIAALLPALYLALSAAFETVRQASAYAGIVQIALSLLTYVPSMLGEELLHYLPISNLWAVLENVLTGKSALPQAVCSLGIAGLAAAAALVCAAVILKKDTTT